jgi:SNF2 family DNA or RNA helicase
LDGPLLEKIKKYMLNCGLIFFDMKVSTSNPFQIIYALFEHEYLGYLFESFAVQLDDKGRLTLRHQNISADNAADFAKGLDDRDYDLIELMDSMQQEVVIRKFHKTKIKPRDFFYKVYDTEKSDKLLQKEIDWYLERRRAKILDNILGKRLFEMGNDGEPTWREIQILDDEASILFHFVRNVDNTHYYATIRHNGDRIYLNTGGTYIVCNDPAWIVCNGQLYHFANHIDGYKLKPFLRKKFIVVPKKIEDTYYRKFIAPLVATGDVVARGFDIRTENYDPVAKLSFAELTPAAQDNPTLFDARANGENSTPPDNGKIVFDLSFDYSHFNFKPEHSEEVSVRVEQIHDNYTFHRILRKKNTEARIIETLKKYGLEFKNSRCTLPKPQAISWLSNHMELLQEANIKVRQKATQQKKYFIGDCSISVEIRENIDWFDIHAVVRFGPYEIPFKDIRKMVLRRKSEIVLPNGEVGVIPDSWVQEYSDFFAFMDERKHNGHQLTLQKHHLALVKDLEEGKLAKVALSSKLEKLRDFESIDEVPAPKSFKGVLRPYQKAGFNWLNFLNKYNFGGCLADDMGLGKTVQTLALLQWLKENGERTPSLLIMPTSLLYNWEMESKRFTPELKIYNYTGTGRVKDPARFHEYDLVLTSYGITRLDIELLQGFYFNYVILDESQAIKNPNSNISKSVKKLKSRHRLILTGTPLENSTLDLWSQMTFINPGLLGGHTFFKNEFLVPIEKKNDSEKTRKLYAMIKPFILRRHKSQVATELPEKVENIKYCSMTPEQEKEYEEVKSFYRNKILDQIEAQGVNKSQMLLLQGLTKLRQLANHPKMVLEGYDGDSGKMDAVVRMLQSAISENHKILIFSQFVKHLTILRKFLQRQKIPFSYLDGSTKDRQAQVEQFQNDDDIKLFLISLKAGGLGLNLTKAEYVFILDPWWNPAVEQQAIDRAHRIGQTNKVFTYKFITKNTVEEKILALQQKKVRLASELINTEERFVKDLSREDIEMLLS